MKYQPSLSDSLTLVDNFSQNNTAFHIFQFNELFVDEK